MHIIITQHALIYFLNYLGKKIFEYQETKPSNKLAPAIFPEFYCVALSTLTFYTFHPTTLFKRVYTAKNQPISRNLQAHQHHDSVICIAMTSYACVSKGFVLIKKVERTHPAILMWLFYFTLCVTSDPLKPDLSSSKR